MMTVLKNNQTLTEEERIKEISRLESSYAMYERAKDDAIKKRTTLTDKNGNKVYSEESLKDTLTLMETMQKDIVDQYVILGGDPDNLGKNDKLYENRYNYNNLPEEGERVEVENERKEVKTEIGDGVLDYLNNMNTLFEKKDLTTTTNQINNKITDFDLSKIKEQFDVIPLPSKGESYANKMSKIPVAYLTAYDENIIVSPNLYKDGTFLDYLLKTKIMNPNINADDLLPGDRDAIILWLRASGYGNEFPITATDNETGKEFDTVVDLSKIKYKDFTLSGDENGWFTYVLPVSKDEIKFSFLTYGEIKKLNEIEDSENLSIKREELKTISDKLFKFKKEELSNTFTKQFGKRIDETIKTIDEWYDNIEVDNTVRITHALTNRLITAVKSINGITDKKYIREYIVKMNIRDSAALRKYMVDNEPGLDFNVEVERPKSHGGGSMELFLSFDQFIFLNIA